MRGSRTGRARSRTASRQLDALGVQVVRFTLRWDADRPTAPAAPGDPDDPAYDWSQTTAVLDALHVTRDRRRAAARSARRPGRTAASRRTTSRHRRPPSRAFATAVAPEYPWVQKWLIWNEPNQRRWLRRPRRRSTSSGFSTLRTPRSTHAIPNAQVAGGGTAPRGSTGGVSPVAWITGMRAPTPDSTPTPTTRIRSTRSERPRSRAACSTLHARSRWRRSAGSCRLSRATSRAPGSG